MKECFNNVPNVDENILYRNYSRLLEILLFGDSSFKYVKNTSILDATTQHIFDTKRFNVTLPNLRKFIKLQKFENPLTLLSPP